MMWSNVIYSDYVHRHFSDLSPTNTPLGPNLDISISADMRILCILIPKCGYQILGTKISKRGKTC